MEPVVATSQPEITSTREPRMDCYVLDLHGVDQTQVAIAGARRGDRTGVAVAADGRKGGTCRSGGFADGQRIRVHWDGRNVEVLR